MELFFLLCSNYSQKAIFEEKFGYEAVFPLCSLSQDWIPGYRGNETLAGRIHQKFFFFNFS